jgi:hypothetical protein
MTVELIDLRAAALEAVRLLDSEASPASRQARQLLVDAVSTTLPAPVRAALDADLGVQAALARIAADQETYFLANEDGSPSHTLFERSVDEHPVSEA